MYVPAQRIDNPYPQLVHEPGSLGAVDFAALTKKVLGQPTAAPTPTRPPAAPVPSAFGTFYKVIAIPSVALSAYHGYKRNDSIGWALVWGFFGGLAPIITPAIALAQGLGKPRTRSNPGRRRRRGKKAPGTKAKAPGTKAGALKVIRGWLRDGLITEAEYKRMRKAILRGEMTGGTF